MSYSPTLGRFLERDPEGYIDGPNVYPFELDNPINFLDPTGTTVVVDDIGPYGAIGQWRIGGGEPVIVVGRDFIDHVKGIPEVRQQINNLKEDLARQAAKEAGGLKPGECKTVSITRKDMASTMTGYRWGAFGTIYHDATASITVCKSKCGDVITHDEHISMQGHDTYHNFDTTLWGFRHVWYGLNAIAGTIRDLYPHAPTPFNIYWGWDEPGPPPEMRATP